MFKKKPTVKPLAPLRSSDRRRTADQIISEYDLHVDTPQDGTPAAGVTALRNALLPDNVQTARFTTTHGPDLKQLSGSVYVGQHPGEDQRVLWFKIEDRIYPTVYTLWKHPGILPLLLTPGMVVKKMQAGADLMTPGLANGPPFPEKAKKGAVVAVASLECPTVPVAVGVCEIDIYLLSSVQGSKGHAVQTMHWAGDEIWAYSIAGKAGLNPPHHIDGWLSEDVGSEDNLASQTASLTLDQDEGGVALTSDADAVAEVSQESASAAGQEEDSTSKDEAVVEMTTKEIDEAFRKAFLYGVYQHMQENPSRSNFGLDFPLSQSFVMANLVQPFLPAYTPDQANSLQIKKSSYKNIKKFIKSLDKQKLLRSKDRDAHEVTILDIDFQDEAITGFKPYRLPKRESAAAGNSARGGTSTTENDAGDSSLGQKLQKLDHYKPRERLLPLFAASNATSSSLFTSTEIKSQLTAYIESENLASQTNKRLVTLNPTLANAVFDGSASLDKDVLAKGTVPRDALIERVISSCSPYYTIIRNNEKSQAAKPKAGAAPKIKIVLETRSGNKTATKVSGVEPYHISPQPLADELRKVCAGSTSVEQLHGSSPKNPVMEIMIQGPQKDAVLKALEKRGVRQVWVEFTDKTKGKKR